MSTRSTDGGTIHSFAEKAKESELPHDEHAERAVLGSVLLDNSLLPLVRQILTPEEFYRESHRLIFAAMIALADVGAPMDPITLGSRVGLQPVIAGLIDGIPRGENVEHHARTVCEKASRRRLSEAARSLSIRAANGATTEEDLAGGMRDLSEIWCPAKRLPHVVDLYGSDVTPTRAEMVVDGLARRVGLRLFWAPPGGLKTHTLLRWDHELLLVEPPARLTGHSELVVRRSYRKVLWIATEETAGGLRFKADMVLRGLGVKELGGEFRYIFAADSKRRVTLDDLPAILEDEHPLDEVVLDSLTGLRPRVVNGRQVQWDLDNDAANDQCLMLRGLAEKHALQFTLVHHTGRDQAKGYRGPTDWWASADIMLGLVPQEGGLVKVLPEKNRDGSLLKPFLLRPSWGPDGFYLEYAGEAKGSATMTPSEKRADDWLRGKGEASQAEIMEAVDVTRNTMTALAARRVSSGAWIQVGTRATGSPVFRVSDGGAQ